MLGHIGILLDHICQSIWQQRPNGATALLPSIIPPKTDKFSPSTIATRTQIHKHTHTSLFHAPVTPPLHLQSTITGKHWHQIFSWRMPLLLFHQTRNDTVSQRRIDPHHHRSRHIISRCRGSQLPQSTWLSQIGFLLSLLSLIIVHQPV